MSISSVEVRASLPAGYVSLNALFTDAHATLLVASDYLHQATNGFNATMARRELIQLCQEIAVKFGDDK